MIHPNKNSVNVMINSEANGKIRRIVLGHFPSILVTGSAISQTKAYLFQALYSKTTISLPPNFSHVMLKQENSLKNIHPSW